MNSNRPARTRCGALKVRKLAMLMASMAVLVQVAPTAVHAQAAATGTIRGRVMNASNGMYLNNARVIVEGTNLEAFTNDFGEYEINNVPAGEITLRATFTGQEPVIAKVKVESGKTVIQDASFNRNQGGATEDGAIMLNEFVVASERFKNAQELATNEERYSTNLKNVVSADMFGDIPEGNVGEFVKFLPGVLVDYGNQAYSNPYDATGISVRGFGAADTAITIDGVPIANASPAGLTRQIGLDMMSINNASRVEVIKVPTPDMPANSIGGTVNLVSKTAFEYAKPTFTWRVYGTIDSTQSQLLKKTPGPSNEKTYKLQPGAELTVAIPFNSKFGISLTASSANQFNSLKRAESTWTSNPTTIPGEYPWTNVLPSAVQGTGSNPTFVPVATTNANGFASVTNPAFTRIQVTDNPRMTNRHSASLKADWKPSVGHLLTGMYQTSIYDSVDVSHRFSFTAQRPDDWSPTHTTGLQWRQNVATPVGQVYPNISTGTNYTMTSGNGARTISGSQGGNASEMTVDARDREGITHTGSLSYKYDKGGWLVQAAGSYSRSDGRAVDQQNGHFSKIDMRLNSVGLVNFYDIKDGVPGRVEVYRQPTTADGMPASTAPYATLNSFYNSFYANPANQIDPTKLQSWANGDFKGFSADAFSRSTVSMLKLDVRRDLDFLPRTDLYSLAIKVGAKQDVQEDKKWGKGTGFRRSTRTGVTIPPVSSYLDEGYVNREPGFGFGPMQWVDAYKLYQLDRELNLFVDESTVYSSDEAGWYNLANTADARDNYRSWVNQNKRIKETRTAAYAQLEGKALKNKLSFVGGARREDWEREGRQPWTDTKWNMVRYADGRIFRETVNGVSYTQGLTINNAYNASQSRTHVFAPSGDTQGEAVRSRLRQLGIPVPDHVYGATNASLESLLLNLKPSRYIRTKENGEPSYSINFAYEITDQIVGRIAWSRTMGMVRLEDPQGGVISGSANTVEINEYEFTGYPNGDTSTPVVYVPDAQLGQIPIAGQIKVGNPTLKPYVSNNWDYSLSYYSKSGGKVTVTYYTKDVKNFQENLIIYHDMPEFAAILNAYEIDPTAYRGFQIDTFVNGEGTAKTQGYEMDAQQNFGFLGRFGRPFTLFASYTHKTFKQPQSRTRIHPATGLPITVTPTTIAPSAEDHAGFGLSFATGRVSLSLKGTYRDATLGDTKATSMRQDGTLITLYDWTPSEVRLDASLNVRLTKRYSFFANGRDILNSERKTLRYDEEGIYPAYAHLRDIKKFGVQVNFGVRGEF